MTTMLLVRHGQNEWVKKHRLAGWIPGVHLNEEGRMQAAAAAGRVAHLPISALYSSPVERCLETAAYFTETLKLPVQPLEAIGEVRYGKWEGKKIKKLAKKRSWYAVQHYPSRHRFPEGESFPEVQYRAVEALEALASKHKQETIVVVSHADLIKLILAHYLGVHMDLFQRIIIAPASISALHLMPNGVVRVGRMNDTGLLRPSESPGQKQSADQKAKDKGKGK